MKIQDERTAAEQAKSGLRRVGVFAQPGGVTNLVTQRGGTLQSPGVSIYTDGTLTTLIVTGISAAGQQIRCNDLTDTAAVHDCDLVQPYFVIDRNSVVLAAGRSQLSLTCQLNIAPGDQAGSISVQWAKIQVAARILRMRFLPITAALAL